MWWYDEFGPDALGTYAGKSYWLATYNWENQNFPIDRIIYTKIGGFANGYVPMFVIIGYQNKIYWNSNSSNFRDALRQAIDEIVAEGVYVSEPMTDQVLFFDETIDIDISEIFTDLNENPVSVTIENNSNTSLVSTEVNGNILTATASNLQPGVSTIILKGQAGEFYEFNEFSLIVCDPNTYNIEDFETNDYSLFPWKFNGNADWIIDTNEPYDGSYCSITEDIDDNQYAEMNVDFDYDFPGRVLFHYKTSCEPVYDYLKFSIDGIEKGRWSGNIDWVHASFDVERGTHTFKWSYHKDSSLSYLGDCVWIDRIVFEGGIPTSIDNEQFAIDNFELYQNYPNPFNPVTDISFSLDRTGQVNLSVYNHAGQLVNELLNRVLSKGVHKINFNASNLNSGIYFYKIETNETSITKKMMLVK